MAPRLLLITCATVGVVLCMAIATPAIGGDTYRISVSGGLDIPDRTITVDGEDFTVSSVALRDPGGTVTVDVSAPAGQEYAVNVWDPDGDIQASTGLTGDGEATFDASRFESETGPYLIGVEADSTIRTVYPVVFEAHDVTADVPTRIADDESASVTAELIDQSGDPVSGVTVVIAGADDEVRVEMDGGDGEYSVDVPANALEAGTYTVFVVVTGTDTVDGTELPIGVSDRHDLEVVTETSTPRPTPTPSPTQTPTPTPADTATPTTTTTDTSGSSGGGGARQDTATRTATRTVTPTPTPTLTQTATPTATATRSPTTTENASPPAERTTSSNTSTDGTDTRTMTSEPADGIRSSPTDSPTTIEEEPVETVITPNATSEDDPADPNDDEPITIGQPGFTVSLTLIALAILGIRCYR